jgi:hypothetical protein
MVEVLSSDIDEVSFGGMAMLPINRFRRGIVEAFKLTNGLGQHGGVVLLADDPVPPLVLLHERRRQLVIAEAASPFPVHRLADAALVGAVDDLLFCLSRKWRVAPGELVS